MVFHKKTAPVLSNPIAIRLYGIRHSNIVPVILLHKPDNLFIKIQSAQRRLPSLESNGTASGRLQDCFAYDIFQRFLRHKAIRSLLPLLCLVIIKAVLAPHITQT